MNAISVDEGMAAQFGIPVVYTKAILFFSASLLTAVAVSLAGTIGFIGLVSLILQGSLWERTIGG